VDAEDSRADAIDDADQGRGTHRDQDRRHGPAERRLRRHDERHHRCHGGGRQVDTAGQHGQCLGRGEDGERDCEAQGRRNETGPQDARPDDGEHHEKRQEQQQQRHNRVVAQPHAPISAGIARHSRACGGACHDRARRRLR
jgi:hypothetical protein